MAIPHALPGQAIDVAPLGTRLSSEQTIALFKSADLEVIRLVLPAGKSLPPHKVAGEITIQCVEGAPTSGRRAEPCCMPGNCSTCPATSCTASLLEDASALVTIVPGNRQTLPYRTDA
jgi:hypothetical protein